MLTTGKTTGVIVDHVFRTINEKEILDITFDVDGEPIGGAIWFTDKSMSMARGQLKVCGFDSSKESLATLDANPKHLSGRKVPIEIEDYNGRLQAKVITSEGPTKKRLAELDKALRSVKKDTTTLHASSEGDDDIPF